jgi:hypothetical protein
LSVPARAERQLTDQPERARRVLPADALPVQLDLRVRHRDPLPQPDPCRCAALRSLCRGAP